MNPPRGLLLAAAAACALSAHAAAPVQVRVIPEPKQVTFEDGAFAIDQYCIVLVSDRASEATRRAARMSCAAGASSPAVRT